MVIFEILSTLEIDFKNFAIYITIHKNRTIEIHINKRIMMMHVNESLLK